MATTTTIEEEAEEGTAEISEQQSEDWYDAGVQNDEYYRQDLQQLFRILRSQAASNAEYFKGAAGAANERFHQSFSLLWEHLDRGVESGVDFLLRAAPMFDYSASQPANGYRSMVTVVHRCCLRIMTLSRYIGVNRESYIFRADHYSRELEGFVSVLGQLRACLFYLQKLVPYCMDGVLFPDEDALPHEDYQTAERLMKEVEALSQEAFYGRCLGFQFSRSMLRPLTTINLVMASYGDVYSRSSRILQLATSVLSSKRYFMNPELRAKQVVNMTRTIDIQFCKGFWALAENTFMHKAPLYICPAVSVDKVLVIGPESFELPIVDSSIGSGMMTIRPPSAHTGVGPVNTRLLSARYRQGQEVWYRRTGFKAPDSPSTGLIIHCHGGGFVAQSSASHQVYLRHWANDLDAPILCVDYSLAPESRFPRQFEEIFYAYCWAIKNCHLLGTTAERVVFVGDSAGANLAVSVAMKLAELGLRKPDGIVSVYGCLLIKYLPSPSRILALMDPLLPIGVLSLCLHAYAADTENDDETIGNGLHVVGGGCSPSESNVSFTTSSSVFSSSSSEGFGDLSVSEMSVSSKTDSAVCLSAYEDRNNGNNNAMTTELCNSRRPNCLNLSTYSSRTDTGLDRSHLTSAGGGGRITERNVDDVASTRVSVGTLLDNSTPAVTPTKTPRGKVALEHHMLTKSCSTPTFRSIPSSLRGVTRVQGKALDNELFHLSTYAELKHFETSPSEMFKTSRVSRSPYLSPYLASDDLLSRLPPVHLLACHLDPMLDDSVMFGRRLRDLGNSVHVDFIPDLPHGFLNFVLISREAKSGSDRCVNALRKFLIV